MSQLYLSQNQLTCLHQVVDQANKQYLRESHHNEKASLNILQVLSAYRLMHPDNQQKLYQAIIYMTKTHNPQNYMQWNKALETFNSQKNIQGKIRNNYCRPQKLAHNKTSLNSFNRSKLHESECFQSKSFAQINLPRQANYSKEESFLDEQQKQMSQIQTNAQTGKRKSYTKPDLSLVEISKNHYISFEPYKKSIEIYHNKYYDKQNINSTNIEESRKRQSAYQYIDAIRSLNKTYKNSQLRTPIDQSFIKNINNSESSHIMSKIHHQYVDPEEQQMIQRAHIFYVCNLRLKVMSSLLANCLVFKKVREHLMKAHMQRKANLMEKAFTTFKIHADMMKALKEKERKADGHFNLQIKQKSLNILKLIYSLKDKKVTSLQKFNKVNFRFLLEIIIQTNYGKQQNQNLSIDLQRRISQYLKDNQIQKLSLILKYFGKHSWITGDNVRNLISNYKTSMCRQMFKILQHQAANNKSFTSFRENNLKKQGFFGLKLRWNKYKSLAKTFAHMKEKKNSLLMQKVMKALTQTIYSTKLYSKRCEYIKKKHDDQIKQRVIIQWMQQAKEKAKISERLSIKAGKFNQKCMNFIKLYSFSKILHYSTFIDNKIDQIIELKDKLNRTCFIKNLRLNIQYKHRLSIKQKEIKEIKSKIVFNQWRQQTTKNKVLLKLSTCIKKIIFRVKVLPMLTENIHLLKRIKTEQKLIVKRAFEHLKKVRQNEQIKMNALMKKIKDKMEFSYNIKFLSALKSNEMAQKIQRRNTRQDQHKKTIKINQKKSSINLFLFNIKENYSMSKEIHLKSQNLKRIKCRGQLNRFHEQVKAMKDNQRNSENIKRFVDRLCVKKTIQNLASNVLCERMGKVILMRKNNISKKMNLIIKNQIKERKYYTKQATRFYEQNLLNKVIVGLLNLLQLSSQVKLIAADVKRLLSQINKFNNMSIAKDLLNNWAKFYRLSKVTQKMQKKYFFRELKNKPATQQKALELISNRYTLNGTKLSTNMKKMKVSKLKQDSLIQKSLSLHKWRTINNIKRSYFNALIGKKHFYMSIKFRAFKLFRISFEVLRTNKNSKNKINNEYIHSLTYYKIKNQRLRTDCN